MTKAAKPPVGKHLFFGNKDLTEAQLSQLTDGENQQELLKTFLKLDERYPGVDEANTRRKDVFLAYASHLLTFAKTNNFTPLKTSTFFSIALATHENVSESEMPASLERSYALFEDLLLRHSIERPPFSVALFNLSEVKLINEFMLNSYFRHLRMYQLVFGVCAELDLQPRASLADAVPIATVLPLSQATSCS